MGQFDDFFKKKGIPEKMNFLGKEYEINPEAMVYSKKGIDKYQQKDLSGAVIDFTMAIFAQPSNQNLYIMRGTAYEDLGNDTEAENDFQKVLELSPDEYIAAYRLGMVYFRKKDFENAIKWLMVSYKNAPDVELKYFGHGQNNVFYISKKIIAGNLGNFLTQVKRYDEGFKYLDDAIKLDPAYPNPYISKGLALAQMGKLQEGIEYLQKAEKLGAGQATIMIQTLKQHYDNIK